MTQAPDLVLTNGTVHTPSGPVQTDVAVRDGRILGLGFYPDAARWIDCAGLDILPGVIDSQVHFREPGLEHKEDLESGSRCAVMGGITAVFEMPNTNPNTDTFERVHDKLRRARHRMWCDHAFYVGATAANAPELAELERIPGTAGVKIFMGASTGSLLVAHDEELARVLASGSRRVAIHAEDEARMNARKDLRVEGDPSSHPVWRDDESAMLATRRILKLAREARRPIHILHVTTPAELELIAQHRDIATCEVTPQHLTLRAEEALAATGRSRCFGQRPRPPHDRGKGQALSRIAQRYARRADIAALDARPCAEWADEPGASDRHDQRRGATRVWPSAKGADRGGL
jgi:dihydroorotase